MHGRPVVELEEWPEGDWHFKLQTSMFQCILKRKTFAEVGVSLMRLRSQAQNGLDILTMQLDSEEKMIAAAFNKRLGGKL